MNKYSSTLEPSPSRAANHSTHRARALRVHFNIPRSNNANSQSSMCGINSSAGNYSDTTATSVDTGMATVGTDQQETEPFLDNDRDRHTLDTSYKHKTGGESRSAYKQPRLQGWRIVLAILAGITCAGLIIGAVFSWSRHTHGTSSPLVWHTTEAEGTINTVLFVVVVITLLFLVWLVVRLVMLGAVETD